MFWVCVNDDLTPFRPVRECVWLPSEFWLRGTAKFLCVKGILFFSFWQSIGISFLVAVKAIKRGLSLFLDMNFAYSDDLSGRVYRCRAHGACTS